MISKKYYQQKKAQQWRRKLLWFVVFLLSLFLTFVFIYGVFDLKPCDIWVLIKSLWGEKSRLPASSGSFPGRRHTLGSSPAGINPSHLGFRNLVSKFFNFWQVTAEEASRVREKVANKFPAGRFIVPRDYASQTSPKDRWGLSFWILFCVISSSVTFYSLTHWLVSWLVYTIYFAFFSKNESDEENV